MKNRLRSSKGFTLVEIMIVVVIIGLLAAMAIPAFQKVRTNSLGKAMANDARQLAGACQQMLLQFPSDMNTTDTGITYSKTTGGLTYSNGKANIQEFVQKISKGYNVSSINYNSTATGNTAAFTLNHPQLAPKDLNPNTKDSAANVGDDISFDTEGKPL